MPTYVVLINWTDQGVRGAKETVNRYEAGRQQLEQAGVRIQSIYWTVGPFDIVTTVEAADDETASAALLSLAGAGNLRTTLMRAFDANEMRAITDRIA